MYSVLLFLNTVGCRFLRDVKWFSCLCFEGFRSNDSRSPLFTGARRKSRQRRFKVGDEVLVLLPTSANKLQLMWRGPFPVTKVHKADYFIDMGGVQKLFHANMLKLYTRRSASVSASVAQFSPDVSAVEFGPCESVPFPSIVGVDVCPQTGSVPSSVPSTPRVEHLVSSTAVIQSDSDDSLPLPTLPSPSEGKETFADVRYDPELTEKQTDSIRELFAEFPTVLTADPGAFTGDVVHEIRLVTDDAIRRKQYSLPFASKEVIVQEVEKMLALGVIEPSTSPYSSPVVLVAKKDGSVRFCIDFRALNKVTVFDAEPIPDVEELFTKLSGARYFTKLDLSKGYWQLFVIDEDRPKTAFQTPIGLFQFVRMPFGLISAPASFVRMMRTLLNDLSINFFDDILVPSPTWTRHLQDVMAVLTKLSEGGLTARPTKIFAGFQQLEFLGHVVGRGSLQPVPEKVSKMLAIATPTTKRQVRALLGLVGYYRQYVPNFASVTAPISDLLTKKASRSVVWSPACAQALRNIQEILSSHPVLLLPDMDLQFVVRTDASSVGIGGVLLQEHEGDLHPVAYVSRKLLDRETRYSTIERECLAIVWVISRFQRYLWGKRFVLNTDHRPLSYLLSGRFKNARIMRWSLALQEFTFEIEPLPGSRNQFADFLSRSACDQSVPV
ncbi:hypothetical protein ACOMHN_055429 [Nucella lapillus]